MSKPEINLLQLYLPLIIWVGLGVILGYKLPPAIPFYLGKFLFWVGVPVSIIAFLRQADLSGSVWMAAAIAWAAILLGCSLAWLWIQIQHHLIQINPINPPHFRHFWNLEPSTPGSRWAQPTQGSFILAAMVGNTGYLGYPVTLALVGSKYFAWALFYDIAGTTLGAYGLGVALAAQFGLAHLNTQQLVIAVFSNPGLISFLLGLSFRSMALPLAIESALLTAAWSGLALSLLLMGMRLSQLRSWQSLRQACTSLVIKMIIVPLTLGVSLSYLGVTGPARLVIVLQMAMPPAFATLIIAEAYDLDRELTVTALMLGSVGLLFTLPMWIWLFSDSS